MSQVFVSHNEETPRLKVDSENYMLPVAALSFEERDLIAAVLRAFATQYWDSLW